MDAVSDIARGIQQEFSERTFFIFLVRIQEAIGKGGEDGHCAATL